MRLGRNHRPALWLLLILTLVAAERIRLLSVPLERDEGEYAYAGQLILEGQPPYKEVYNMKMPGTYAAYALIMAVFGETVPGIRFGFMLVNLGCIVLMYFVGRRLFDSASAIAASATYALLSLSPHVQGFNAHATHFVVLAALAGTLVLLRALENGRSSGLFWSGVLFGISFLMKQPGGAFVVFGFTLVMWSAWHRQPRNWKATGLRIGVYGAGVAAPIVLTGLILRLAGVWDKFWWWTVVYASVHGMAMPWSVGKLRLAKFFTDWSWDNLFWFLAVVGLLCVLLRKGRADQKFFFLSFLFFSFAAVCPAFHFTAHYFVLMLPVVALLAVSAATSGSARLAAQPSELLRASPWIAFGLIWVGVAWSYLGAFILWSPNEVASRIYLLNDFQVYPIIAKHLMRDAPKTSTLAVIGSEPELFFYTHLRSVTGYIYMYDLVHEQPYRQQMEHDMISEVERGRPDYIAFVNVSLSWTPRLPESVQAIQNWFVKYTDSEYEPYGVVTFGAHQYVWRPDCLKLVPPGHRLVIIYQRKGLKSLSAKTAVRNRPA